MVILILILTGNIVFLKNLDSFFMLQWESYQVSLITSSLYFPVYCLALFYGIFFPKPFMISHFVMSSYINSILCTYFHHDYLIQFYSFSFYYYSHYFYPLPHIALLSPKPSYLIQCHACPILSNINDQLQVNNKSQHRLNYNHIEVVFHGEQMEDLREEEGKRGVVELCLMEMKESVGYVEIINVGIIKDEIEVYFRQNIFTIICLYIESILNDLFEIFINSKLKGGYKNKIKATDSGLLYLCEIRMLELIKSNISLIFSLKQINLEYMSSLNQSKIQQQVTSMQGNQNYELKKKFQRKQTFFHEMQGISKKYFQLQQQVYYSPVKDLNPNMIVKIQGKPESKRTIFQRQDYYIINGQFQPKGERTFERLILQVVQTIPRPTKPFGIIYINTFAASEAYNDFKRVMELLPFEYLSNLTKIYVLQATFMNKALFWLSFGTVTNYIKSKTVNIGTLKEIQKYTRFDVEFLKKTLPKNVVQQLIKYEVKQQIKPLQAPLGHDKPKLSLSQKPQLKTLPIDVPVTLSKIKSEDITQYNEEVHPNESSLKNSNKKTIIDYQLGPTGAPKILQLLIYYFKDKQDSLKVQGIFRKSVSIDDETQILTELDKKNYNYLETVTNPHIIANALKRFLAYLSIPIIPYQTFNTLMAKDSDPHFNNIVIESINALPKINRMAIFLLFSFLRRVIQFSQENKMTQNNICIVFGPCLMRSEISSIKDLIYAKKIIVVTSIIFRQFESIFGDIKTRNLLKRNSYMQYRKDQILQRITKPKEISLSPTLQQQKPVILDKTTDYIKEALQEKQTNSYYLEIEETQEAIQQLPKNSQFKNSTKNYTSTTSAEGSFKEI